MFMRKYRGEFAPALRVKYMIEFNVEFNMVTS